MSFIKRQEKESVRNFEILQQVKEELGIDDIVRCDCQPKNKRMSPNVAYPFCLNKCLKVCQPFFGWHHIIEDCNNLFCSKDNICEECVQTIEKYKVLIQVFRVLFELTPRERKKRLRKYKKKRH